MTAPLLDNEFMKYWSKLTIVEKESLLSVAKNYVQLKEEGHDTDELRKQLIMEEREKYLKSEGKSFSQDEVKEMTLKVPKEVSENDLKMIISGMLYEKAIFSSGQAAEYAGITKRKFIETIGHYGFSIFNYASSDLARDINNA